MSIKDTEVSFEYVAERIHVLGLGAGLTKCCSEMSWSETFTKASDL